MCCNAAVVFQFVQTEHVSHSKKKSDVARRPIIVYLVVPGHYCFCTAIDILNLIPRASRNYENTFRKISTYMFGDDFSATGS